MKGLAPLPLEGERVLVLGFDRHQPACDLSRAAAVLIVASGPADLGEVRRDWLPWAALWDGRAAAFGPSAVVVCTQHHARPQALAAALALGARRCLVIEAPGTHEEVALGYGLALAASRLSRRFLARIPGAKLLERALSGRLDPPWPTTAAALRFVDGLVALPRRLRPGAPGAPVTFFVGSLGAGGAERQLTYLVRGLQQRGIASCVVSAEPLAGDAAHYAPELSAAGAELVSLQTPARHRLVAPQAVPPGLREDFLAHPAATWIAPLVDLLSARQPEVLHCWLDRPNLTGALAGLLAGVPRIVLGARNVSPRWVPRIDEPWLQPTAQGLGEAVTWVGNSAAVADDYARWTGLPRARIEVVRNGFELVKCQPLTLAERAAVRAEVGAGAELVVAVFRLEEEKRPFDFLEVVARLVARHPRLRVVHVGGGGMSARVQEVASERGLADNLTFLGRRSDPWRFLGAADLSLLVSEIEGLPNVALESQALGVPIVLTDAGGSREAIEPGRSGALVPVGDVEGATAAALELLRDPSQRATWGRAGRELVAERFGVERMVSETLAVYQGRARGGVGT